MHYLVHDDTTQGPPRRAATPKAGAMVTGGGGPAVMGVGLEPGERVVYFRQPSYRSDKKRLLVIGLITLIFGVGLLFIVLALLYERIHPRAQIVTNRRVIIINGAGVPASTELASIVEVEAARFDRSRTASNVPEIVVGIVLALADDRRANRHDKLSRAYWANTVAVVVVLRGGRRATLRTRDGFGLGSLLVQCVTTPGFVDRLPTVATPA